MKKSVYVMGLCYSHDASVTLIKDGVPLVGIQKERLTRKKHDGSIMNINLDECINYCVEYAGISLNDIDIFVENSPTILYCKEKDKILGFNDERLLKSIPSEKILQISHHLAHAYCVYGISPFNKCAVMIVDGQGNYKEDITEDLSDALIYPENSESSYIERESFYEISGNNHKVIRKNLSTIHKSFTNICGLGHMYEQISSYVFNSRFDAGKLMGLAPYGKDFYDFDFIELGDNGQISYNINWIKNFKNKNISSESIEDNWYEYSNLAYKAQQELEKSILFLSKRFKKNTNMKYLAYSGGVSLNCGSNMIIEKSGLFKDIFIAPPASDVGISLGCAYYGYLYVLKYPKKSFDYVDYLGKSYNNEETLTAIKKYENNIKYHAPDNIYSYTSKLISEGKIIGWFQGGSEFGPRALGNRSIIADPRNEKMKDILNNNIKFRESFRPFAPSVLQEYAGDYFDISYSPYMLLTANVKEDKKKLIPSIVHIDGTSRIQTVNQKSNFRYYSLINEFFKLTGIPLVMNTSFNIKAEPIVETPEDAIKTFIGSNLDYVVIGDYFIERK